jgi:hypothetical protein
MCCVFIVSSERLVQSRDGLSPSKSWSCWSRASKCPVGCGFEAVNRSTVCCHRRRRRCWGPSKHQVTENWINEGCFSDAMPCMGCAQSSDDALHFSLLLRCFLSCQLCRILSRLCVLRRPHPISHLPVPRSLNAWATRS